MAASKKYTKAQLEDMSKGDLMKILIREYDYNAFEFQGDKEAVVKEILKLQKKGGGKSADAEEEEDNVSQIDVLKGLLRKFGGRVTKKDDEESLAEKVGAKWDDCPDEEVPELESVEWDALQEIGIDVSEYRPDEDEEEEEDEDEEEYEEEDEEDSDEDDSDEEEEEDEDEDDEEEEDEDDDEEEEEDGDDDVEVDPEELVAAFKKVKSAYAALGKAITKLDGILGNV